ncbi:MAG: hypothetical protein FH762_14065 [Firmicutes bacterium]|nr:hypothetical protein [Bacillota bacterium]
MTKPGKITGKCGDVFVASVINQKAVNKSAQQILVAFAIQFFIELEALFGFATNQDNDKLVS